MSETAFQIYNPETDLPLAHKRSRVKAIRVAAEISRVKGLVCGIRPVKTLEPAIGSTLSGAFPPVFYDSDVFAITEKYSY